MVLNWNEIKSKALLFSKTWADACNEDSQAKPFWIDFFEIFGITNKRVATFELNVKKLGGAQGFVDLFWPGVLLVEHKSRDKNLDEAMDQALGHHVIAHIEEAGRSRISGVIYVRKDSGITDLAQLKGRTIIFGGGEDAMVSYVSTSSLLQRAGLKKGDFKPIFAVNPPNTWLRLRRTGTVVKGYGSADGVTWSELGTVTVSGLGQQVYVGPYGASENPGRTMSARLRDIADVGATGTVAAAPVVELPGDIADALAQVTKSLTEQLATLGTGLYARVKEDAQREIAVVKREAAEVFGGK